MCLLLIVAGTKSGDFAQQSRAHFVITTYSHFAELDYKIPKLKFAQELEVLIIKDIIEKCGGNPEKVKDILNTG